MFYSHKRFKKIIQRIYNWDNESSNNKDTMTDITSWAVVTCMKNVAITAIDCTANMAIVAIGRW